LRRWSGVEPLDGASYSIGTRLWKGAELSSPSCLDPATLPSMAATHRTIGLSATCTHRTETEQKGLVAKVPRRCTCWPSPSTQALIHVRYRTDHLPLKPYIEHLPWKTRRHWTQLEQGCLGRDDAWGTDAPFCALREIAVKTATLRALEKSLEDERHYLETSALLVSGQRQEDSCKQRARRITSIVACLRTEITARASPSQRNPGEAQRFDDYLQSVLEIHLELAPVNSAMQGRHAA